MNSSFTKNTPSQLHKGIDFIGITVSFFCHDGEGNFLMNLRGPNCRDENGRWDIGGGGVEFDSTPEETLVKEIEEEYCTKVLKYEFLGYRDVQREQKGVKTHWLSLDFRVLVDRKTVKNGEPHKFDDLQWFQLDTIPSPVHSQFPLFLSDYKGRL
jgi:8-oxo-dGTP diphosphatase